MASLIDELISVLQEECEVYKTLTEIAGKKTKVIVHQNLDELSKITALERDHVDVLVNLEKKRREVSGDIATVLNRKEDDLTLQDLIHVLKDQNEVQGRLKEVHDQLKQTLKNFTKINEINKKLIQESMELIDFNLNFIQGMYQAPETANYSKNAVNVSPNMELGIFDAKQ